MWDSSLKYLQSFQTLKATGLSPLTILVSSAAFWSWQNKVTLTEEYEMSVIDAVAEISAWGFSAYPSSPSLLNDN